MDSRSGPEATSTPHRGLVLNVQRMSTEDGPGIRSTVFLKGCPLRCVWCHNPESISPQKQLHWVDNRCVGCLTCLRVCPRRALSQVPNGISISRHLCGACGACVEACPAAALELWGQEYDLESLVAELMKDKAFYDSSSGGITLSGGEPAFQGAFVRALLERLHGLGLHTALDTSGQCSFETLERLYPFCHLLMLDLKEIDSDRHRKWTGLGNSLILDNALRTADVMRRRGRPTALWIRTPLIPETTDSEENIAGLAHFIQANLADVLERWELCAFNHLGRSKYQQLGETWRYEREPLLKREHAERLREVALSSGLVPERVVVTGSFRLEARGE